MLSNNQVKHINVLKLKKYRDEYKEFIAEGNTLVTDLINSSYQVAGVYALHQWIVANLNLISRSKVPVFEADPIDMERITALSSPNPVLAIIKIPVDIDTALEVTDSVSLEKILPGIFSGLSMMLEDISDPGNFGSILRIDDWFGIRNIICSGNCVELFNPKVVQSSMGSVARVRVYYTDLSKFLEKVKGRIPVYGTFLQGDSLYTRPLGKEGLIIIGSEAHGISGRLSAYITDRLFIPSFGSPEYGKAESLNAAVAAAIVVAEFRRREYR